MLKLGLFNVVCFNFLKEKSELLLVYFPKYSVFVNEQRLSPSSAVYSAALHSWLAHYCQRFDVSPALSFVGHDGDSVSTL